MGQVLQAPVTTKDSGHGIAEEKRLAWGYSGMQGWRVSMEDAHLAVPSLEGEGWQRMALFGVMDGHGGEAVALYCEKHLPSAIVRGSSQDVGGALISAFHKIDEQLADPDSFEELHALANTGFMQSKNVHPNNVGCTANVCCVTPSSIVVANTGDSRSVLCRNGQAVPLSEDHKPNCPGERERIYKAGGTVERSQHGNITQYRVNGNLNLSRSIGDLEYKKNTNLLPNEQMICATPEVRVFHRQAADEFLVIACDGVWDVMGSQDVVDFIRERLPQGSFFGDNALDPTVLSDIVEELLDNCVSPDLSQTGGLGGDNMTAVVIALGGAGEELANESQVAIHKQADQILATVDDKSIVPNGLCGCATQK